MRIKITTEMIAAAYYYSKKVFEGSIIENNAVDELNSKFGMNRGSASGHISNFKYIMAGRTYKRTFSHETTEYFLRNILADYGVLQLKIALDSVNNHIIYYNNLGNGKQTGTQLINDKYYK